MPLSRLIELEAAMNPGQPDPAMHDFTGRHTFVRVPTRCRLVPGILQATKESRAEAQKKYKLVDFERQNSTTLDRMIYYNKDADIIFIG
jgi:hypothetical protein